MPSATNSAEGSLEERLQDDGSLHMVLLSPPPTPPHTHPALQDSLKYHPRHFPQRQPAPNQRQMAPLCTTFPLI